MAPKNQDIDKLRADFDKRMNSLEQVVHTGFKEMAEKLSSFQVSKELSKRDADSLSALVTEFRSFSVTMAQVQERLKDMPEVKRELAALDKRIDTQGTRVTRNEDRIENVANQQEQKQKETLNKSLAGGGILGTLGAALWELLKHLK